MIPQKILFTESADQWVTMGQEYIIDFSQRWILFIDALRKRGNNYNEHLNSGQPPVLVFDYEIISDGRKLERPVNYQLIKILDPEIKKSKLKTKKNTSSKNSRKRPIIVIDPRAGHGPGIGGSKMDSQIGVALKNGYPVYFMLFFTNPEPGQTIADVQQCQVHFLKKVRELHPEASKPAVIGNCQAGWAAALIGADEPDITGPLVLNGSPLSYWGGVKGANPMRYNGGILGGSWLASLGSDMGNGQFDGANLVAGFEMLNLTNTLWTKQYNLFSKIDTEEKRFLDFEKWWGGFFLLSTEEISFIVKHLFISDELEHGHLKLDDGKIINLKNFKEPMVIFASLGDNITPPQQALNWITRVYKSVDEIKKYGQVIIYLLHENIGHLGIFVSSRINKKEHTEIIGHVDNIDFLSPGLYEMVIDENISDNWDEDHLVKFVERDMKDIMDMDDGVEDEEAFQSVSAISSFNNKLYKDLFSPFVQLFSTSFSAEFLRQIHHMRMQRYMFSDLNPFMLPFEKMAAQVKKQRKKVSKNNIFLQTQELFSDLMKNNLGWIQDCRDNWYETFFYSIYGNQYAKKLFYSPGPDRLPQKIDRRSRKRSDIFQEIEKEIWLEIMKRGGFETAVVRAILAVVRSNQIFDMRQYVTAASCMQNDERLIQIKPDMLKQMIKEQSAILEKDRNMAVYTIPDLVPREADKRILLEIANCIAQSDEKFHRQERFILKQIENTLFPETIDI
ncbi:MAG: DUF3141 domain-containing protein [Desulfobacteraceae bacterium]|nr:DUF3141 domain-containing protein [Desulfobacteraceae bacterium]